MLCHESEMTGPVSQAAQTIQARIPQRAAMTRQSRPRDSEIDWCMDNYDPNDPQGGSPGSLAQPIAQIGKQRLL